MKRIPKLFALLLALLTALPLTGTALAAESIDLSRDVTLTLRYQDGGVFLPGARFRLYYAASVSADGTSYTLSEDFQNYPIDLSNLDQAGSLAAASTLAGYAALDGLSPLDSGVTVSDGTLAFPTSGSVEMKPGLYLVVGQPCTADGYIYTPTPFLTALPARENGRWQYAVTAVPKFTRTVEPVTGGGSTITRKVLKVWDDGGSAGRPDAVTVCLLKNGAVEDTVTLSAENGWRWTWEELDPNAQWQVAELPVDGYTVTVERAGITFVVTNTAEPDNPDPVNPNPDNPNPDNPSPDNPNPDPSGPEDPDHPGSGITSGESDEPGGSGITSSDGDEPGGSGITSSSGYESGLPQTGQLWWPVPVLLCAGLALIILGLFRKGRGHE